MTNAANAKRSLADSRLYTIADTGYLPPERWAELTMQLIAGGADLVQLRAKEADPATRQELMERMAPIVSDRAHLIANDHLDLALSTPACGLHIGQDDMPAKEARQALGPDRILGLSTHSAEQARAALELEGIIDYFCVGPVFPTRTKPDYVDVGLDLIREVASWQPVIPWFAIGGIHRQNVATVRAAGATRIVVVSDILEASDPVAACRELRQAMES